MSENLEPMLTLMNSLPSLLKQTEPDLSACKTSESNGIFDLISHLNDLNNSAKEDQEERNIQTPSENTSEQLEDDDDVDEYEEQTVNEKEHKQVISIENSENTAPKPTRIPMARQIVPNKIPLNQSNSLSINNNVVNHQTKIPRMAMSKLPVRPVPATNLTTLPLDLTSSSVSSISQPETDENAKSFSIRTPRSFLKTPTSLNQNISSQTGDKNDSNVLKDKKTIINNKRGQSQSAVFSSKSSSNRSLSNADSSFFLNDQNCLKDSKKQVRYIIRHKPRDSQVKIFSQKLVLKNVSSKIGSLEKASHVPGGGSVVIENRALNWEAKAKIGSLEKAATYTPGGGNIKIESQKLNWEAKSKIGSLEKANYTPGGGKVKIENRKLNFKEKAKPKTDTGLIVIETDSPNSYLSQSQANLLSVSNEQMSF